MVLNFSEHGFGFRAVKRVRPKEEVKFAFNLADHRRLEGRGRLEWADKEGRVAGLQFTDVSEEFRAEMRQWLSTSAEYSSKSQKDSPVNGELPSADAMSQSLAARRREALGKAAPPKSGRSLSVVPSHNVPTNPVPLSEPEEEEESSVPENIDNESSAKAPWATLPPALGAERKPSGPRPSPANDFAAATAFKLASFDSQAAEPDDIAEEPAPAEELAQPVTTERKRQAAPVLPRAGKLPHWKPVLPPLSTSTPNHCCSIFNMRNNSCSLDFVIPRHGCYEILNVNYFLFASRCRRR